MRNKVRVTTDMLVNRSKYKKCISDASTFNTLTTCKKYALIAFQPRYTRDLESIL